MTQGEETTAPKCPACSSPIDFVEQDNYPYNFRSWALRCTNPNCAEHYPGSEDEGEFDDAHQDYLERTYEDDNGERHFY